MGLFQDGFESLWCKRLFRMDRHGHDAVMFRVVEIVMTSSHVDQGKPGVLEGFDSLFPGYPGEFHATTASLKFHVHFNRYRFFQEG